jgi:hypothetical protein
MKLVSPDNMDCFLKTYFKVALPFLVTWMGIANIDSVPAQLQSPSTNWGTLVASEFTVSKTLYLIALNLGVQHLKGKKLKVV